MLHPLNFDTVVFLVLVPDNGAILHIRANKRKESRLLKLLWAALHVATEKRKLELALFDMVAICFDHSQVVTESYPQVVTESYPQVLSVHNFLQYFSCQ